MTIAIDTVRHGATREPGPARGGDQGRRGDLWLALRDLVHEAAAVGLIDDAGTATADLAAAALGRILDGFSRCGDESLAAVTIPGARVFWVEGGPDDLAAVRRLVEGEGWTLAERAGAVVVLMAATLHSDDDHGRRLAAARSARRIASHGASLRVGVSAPAVRVGDVPALAADARGAARLARCEERIVLADDRWADLLLQRASGAIASTHDESHPLMSLRRRDPRSSQVLIDSLSSWLRHDRDTAAAAAELFVHPNTLRYRLRRVRELTGIDLDDRRQRLVVELLLLEA